MTSSNSREHVEEKIVQSIMERRPKRADIYWFIHVETTNDPYSMDYHVDIIIPQDLIMITFKLGFRVEQRIGLYFREVVKKMVARGEVDIVSRYQSLNKEGITGDFTFIVLKKFLSFENELNVYDRIILSAYFFLRKLALSEQRWFGLDSDEVEMETTPLIVNPVKNFNLREV